MTCAPIRTGTVVRAALLVASLCESTRLLHGVGKRLACDLAAAGLTERDDLRAVLAERDEEDVQLVVEELRTLLAL